MKPGNFNAMPLAALFLGNVRLMCNVSRSALNSTRVNFLCYTVAKISLFVNFAPKLFHFKIVPVPVVILFLDRKTSNNRD